MGSFGLQFPSSKLGCESDSALSTTFPPPPPPAVYVNAELMEKRSKSQWMEQQKENLIILTIEQTSKPTIKMVTEAGIIGKIGLNDKGVGVCLNAIRAKGMDPTRLPCHLGLRMVLESESREEAVAKLERYGIASACHMLIADPSGGVGVEW